MSYKLNDKIVNLVPYEPISGDYKIRLDANECNEKLPDAIREKMLSAVNSVAFNRYPDPNCTDLRKSFADFYDINFENVSVGNGSDELLFLLQSSFLEKNDKVLVVSPDFSMYEFYSSICENKCYKISKNSELNVDVDTLISTINTEKINMVIFSNPCNPTGQGIYKEDIKKLITSVNCLIVLDEAYMDFWGEDNSFIKDVNLYDNLIVLRTASKAIGLAGIRLGFAIANKTITNAIMATKSPYNVNSISQSIGKILYEEKSFLKNRIKTIVENTKWLYNELVGIQNTVSDFKVYETKTNFVFIKTSFSKDLWQYLIDNSLVIRYMGDYIRITSGTKEENCEVIRLIKKYISER